MNDPWGVMVRAEELGWIDPGFTEPLEETARRAREFIKDHDYVRNRTESADSCGNN